MEMKKIGLICLFLISAISTTLVFQNCSKVNYNEIHDNPVNPTGKTNRIITLNPTFNTENADMKVLFIVDDSYTMSQSQARLSNAIDSLMNPLFGRNVEFKIVSTSGIPSNEIDYKINRQYLDNKGQVLTESQALSTQNYFVENTISNLSNERHAPLQSLKNYSQSQFNTVKNKIKSAILNVGVNGSDTEEGLCSVARQLFDPSSSSFFKKGDKAAVIILTDEDDSSVFSACVTKYKQQISSRPVVYYSYLEQRAKLTLEYQAVRDGLTVWIPVTWGVGLPNGQNFNINSTCHSSDISIATNIITEKGYVIRNITSCTYEAVQSTRYGADLGDDGSIADKNLCSSTVQFQGSTYNDLYSYVAASHLSAVSGSCQKYSQPAHSMANIINAFTSVIESDTAALSAQDLESAVIHKSNELFGTGFIYASLIRKNNESCALQSGQSYGTKYETLSNHLPQNSVIESLCATDFSNILSRVSQFIVTRANNSYVVQGLTDAESILSVSIQRQGQKTALSQSQYEVVGSTITFTNFSLQTGDILEVSVGTL